MRSRRARNDVSLPAALPVNVNRKAETVVASTAFAYSITLSNCVLNALILPSQTDLSVRSAALLNQEQPVLTIRMRSLDEILFAPLHKEADGQIHHKWKSLLLTLHRRRDHHHCTHANQEGDNHNAPKINATCEACITATSASVVSLQSAKRESEICSPGFHSTTTRF